MNNTIRNGVEWLSFEHLDSCKKLVHGIFLRHGGVSEGAFESLNFSSFQGDAPKNVMENRQRALNALNLTQYSHLHQVHGNRVIQANPHTIEQADGLITDVADMGLLILHADCQAAIFYDPIHHAVANIHCGWRGNVHNIYQNTVAAMRTHYGSRPEDLLVGISPSLGPTAAEFINYQAELPPSFYPFRINPTHFDLWEISRWQLRECGVLDEHIEIAHICTYSHPDICFSYRRAKRSGRHGTLVALTRD